jgi:outer membrane protein TolC
MMGQKIEIGIPNQYQGGLSVSLPIFAPTLYKSMKLTKTDVALAVEQARSSKQDLVNQVTKAFYQTLLAQDSYAVLEKSFAQSEENFRIVNAKFEQGRVSEFDKISAEVQMRNLKPSVISARNAVELSKLQLLVLMNIEPETEFELIGSLKDYEESVYAGILTADTNSLKENSALKQMDMNVKMLQQTLSLNKQNFAPMVALQFNYMYTCMTDNFKFKDYEWNPYSNVSLSISVPLFKYSNFSNMKKTNIQIGQLMQNRDYTARQLAMQQQSYLNSMAASAEQVSSNKEAITQAEKGRAIAEKLYEVGRGTILELNSAEVALTQAQLTYAQSIFDYLSAKADLDKLQGKEYVKE